MNPEPVTDPDHAASMPLEEVRGLKIMVPDQLTDSPYNFAITQFVFSGHRALL
jgi:hypothetical protein